jgi:hypothetical protein
MHENLSEFLKKARKKEDKLLTKLQEKGILDPKLLDIVWEDRLKDKQDLLTLLVKFGLFVPLLRQVESSGTKESAGDLYLVPAILPTSLVRHPSTATPKLVGYLIFALKKQMEGMRKKGYVTVDEVKRDGFFPMGLGPAVTGEIVSECQCFHDMTLDDMQLSSTEIFAAFGQHEFLLRTCMELQMMELVIMVDSSLLITERVLDLVKTAAEKMVPNIDFALAVDLESRGVFQNGAVDKPRSSLVIISGQGGLQDKLTEGGTLEIPVGPGKKWTSVKAQKHFEKWIPDKGLREQGYDCFISYRWTTSTSGGMDTKLVDGIYKKLSPNVVGAEKRKIHVFLDRHCLEDGRRFDKDFAKALLKSTVVIPIVSYVALQKMVSLNKDSPIDNLLVEWVIVAELQDLGLLDACLPVLLGNVFETRQKGGKFTSNIFAEGIVAKLPEVVVSAVVSFVQQVFDDNGIAPSKHLHTRTVKGTVETIMKALGVPTWEVTSNPNRGANGDDSVMHTHAEWTRNLFSTVATKAMFCLEKLEAEGKSKVTQVCHDPPVTGNAHAQVVTDTSIEVTQAGQEADHRTPEAGQKAGPQTPGPQTPGKGKAQAKPFEQWDVDEVCRLVQSIDGVGFAEAANAIKKSGIDGKFFSEMLRNNDDDLTISIEKGGLGFTRLQLKVVKAKIDEGQGAESWKDNSDAHLAGGSTSAEKSANHKFTSQKPQINELQKVLSRCCLHNIIENTAF